DVPPFAGFAKDGNVDERVQGLEEARGTSIDGFPFLIEETGEALQRLADIHGDVLSVTRAESPQRRYGDGLGSQTDRRHRPKPKRAGNDRIVSVEGESAAAVRSRQSDVFQDLVDAGVEVEIRTALRVRKLGLKRLGEQIRLRPFGQESRRCSHCKLVMVRARAFRSRL